MIAIIIAPDYDRCLYLFLSHRPLGENLLRNWSEDSFSEPAVCSDYTGLTNEDGSDEKTNAVIGRTVRS